MKSKVFLDTNIILDLLAVREKFILDAEKIFSLGEQEKIKVYI
jgi:hypothetical protein